MGSRNVSSGTLCEARTDVSKRAVLPPGNLQNGAGDQIYQSADVGFCTLFDLIGDGVDIALFDVPPV